MWLTRVSFFLCRVIYPVSRIINGVGVGILVVMMFFTVTDISLRFLFNSPIAASFELVEFMMGIVVCLALANTGVIKGHVRVELILNMFPKRVREIVDTITGFFSLCVVSLITWQSFVQAKVLSASGLTSSVLYIPIYPFLIIAGFGFAMFTIVVLIDFLNSLAKSVRK